jgi:hypothetical protein
MKKLFFLIFLISISSFSQNSFLLKKDGSKVAIKDDFNAIDIIEIDKRVAYVIPGKTWQKYVTFKDLDYASFGPYIFKSFKIKNSYHGYFVLADDVEKRLVCLVTEITTQTGKTLYSTVSYYKVLVLDSNDNVIDQMEFKGTSKNDTNVSLRKEVPGFIKKYFDNCPKVIERMNSYITDDEFYKGILGFFDSPIYIKCN